MEILKNLIEIVHKSQIDTLENCKEDNGLLLYKAINEGKVNTTKEAADLLFPNSNHKSLYARRAKKRLLSRIINSILSLNEESNSNDYNKSFVTQTKKLAAVKILLSKGNRSAAIGIAENTIKQAIKYHFTEIVIGLSEILRNHYASPGNSEKYNHFQALLLEYRQLRDYEEQASDRHRELQNLIAQSKTPDETTIKLSIKYADEFQKIIGQYNSHKLNFFAYSLNSIKYQVTKNYKALKTNCEEALNYFNNLPFDSNPPKRAFQSFLIPILITEGQHNEAFQTIQSCLVNTKRGGRNWIAFNQYKIINAFYAEEYQTGYDVMQMIQGHSLYKKLEEEFRVYEAFLHFFSLTDRLDIKRGKFKLGKFLNEVTILEKDKKGMNVNILILQILFLLHQKKWGAIIDRMEPLQNYRYRHLHNDSSTNRSNQFLKLLQLLPKHSFILEPIEKEASPILSELESTPSNLMNHLDMEIVPYIDLWKMIKELLL